ncbi:hypothetical protein GCM10023321_85650 [Pseudonocardia eucalypti]|uniref:Uncharacterized protein n=2 Tax=Pseudonocardia eucalypti TaxID=648755 RepID=A0ABP9RFW2_9PSEU
MKGTDMTSSHPFPNPEPRPRGRAAAEAAARRRALRRAARIARRARRIERAEQREHQHACPPQWTPQQHAEAARRHERHRMIMFGVLFLLWTGSTIVALAYVVTARHQATGHTEPPTPTSTAASTLTGTARVAVVRPVAFTTELPAHTPAHTGTAPAPGTWAAIRPGNDDTRGCRVASASAEREPGGLVVRTGPLDISIGDRDTHRDRDNGRCVNQTNTRDRDRDRDDDKDRDRDRAKDRGRCVCVIPGHRTDRDPADWDERDRGGWDRPWNRDYPRSSWPGPGGWDRSGYERPGNPGTGRPGEEVCRSYPPRVHPDVPNGGTVCSNPDRPSGRW